LTLAWNNLKKVSDGTNYAQPSFTEIGGGWYKFDINTSEPLTGVIDASATVTLANERYVPVYIDPADYLYEVAVTPVYLSDSDALIFAAFLLQNGVVPSSGLTNCVINVYDSTHTLLFSVSSASNTNGMFIITKSSPGLVANTLYYAQVVITYNTITYTSLNTYFSLE
jgi:hypothetical protein